MVAAQEPRNETAGPNRQACKKAPDTNWMSPDYDTADAADAH